MKIILLLFATAAITVSGQTLPLRADAPAIRRSAEGLTDYSQYYQDKWISFETRDGDPLQFNAARAFRDGNFVQAWFRVINAGDEKLLAVLWFEFDCTGKRQRNQFAQVFYKRDGDALVRLDPPPSSGGRNSKFEPIKLGSRGDTMQRIACGL